MVAGANVHDTKLLEATLAAIVVERPQPTDQAPQHLCLDKGYDNPTGHQAAAAHGYQAHIRRIGEEKLDSFGEKTHPARRWVVERTLSWLSKCRGLLVRYDKKASNFLGLLQLACGLLWYRRVWRPYCFEIFTKTIATTPPATSRRVRLKLRRRALPDSRRRSFLARCLRSYLAFRVSTSKLLWCELDAVSSI